MNLTPNQALSLLHRLIHLCAWAISLVIINSAVILGLVVCLLLDVSGSDIRDTLLRLQSLWGWQVLASALGFLGLSGGALIAFGAKYLKAWIVGRSLKYLFAEIDRRNIQ